MNEKLSQNKEYIKNISGISKRLYLAFIDLIENSPDVENVLFHLCAVIESTAKVKYPEVVKSKTRFLKYVDENQEDLLFIWSQGVKIKMDGFWDKEKQKSFTIGEILYKVRCSNYHDPEELFQFIEINHSVSGIGLKKLSPKFGYALFLLLLSDYANKSRIDNNLFDGVGKIGNISLQSLIGNRDELLKIYKRT